MHIEILSDDALLSLHQLIREAQWADDATEVGVKPYGVRQHSDWQKQADEFEAEMSRRRVAFMPIDW